jgi:translation initiation factor IF-2
MDETTKKGPLTMTRPNRLELTKTVESGKVKQNFQHGRSKTVTVEVRKTRTFAAGDGGGMVELKKQGLHAPDADKFAAVRQAMEEDTTLTSEERQSRLRALEHARSRPIEEKKPLTRENTSRADAHHAPIYDKKPLK